MRFFEPTPIQVRHKQPQANVSQDISKYVSYSKASLFRQSFRSQGKPIGRLGGPHLSKVMRLETGILEYLGYISAKTENYPPAFLLLD